MPYELRKFENGNSFGYRVVNPFNGEWTSSEAIAQFVDNHYVLSWKTKIVSPVVFGVIAGNGKGKEVANKRISEKAEELLKEVLREEKVRKSLEEGLRGQLSLF